MPLLKNRAELVIYIDIGLVGSFVRFVKHPSDVEKVFLEYKPKNSLKTVRYSRPISKFDIKSINIPQSSIEGSEGVEEKIIFIQTNEPGSILNVLNEAHTKELKKLRDENETLKLLTSNQEAELEEFRSGTAKAVAGMKRVVQSGRDDRENNTPGFFRSFDFDN